MTDKHFHPDESLRGRAEKSINADEGKPHEPQSSDDAKRLVHELEVHQVELEMQDEELRTTQGQLESSRARYFDLYDLAPVGYFTLSEKGLILEANVTGAVLLGVGRSDLVNQPLTRFILPEDQDIYYRHRKQLLATRSPQVCELRLVRKDAAPVWARLDATATQDDESGATVCRIVVSDITERKRAEESLRQNERFVQGILRGTPNLIYIYDLQERRNVYANRSTLDFLGYTPEEIQTMGPALFRNILHPDDAERVAQHHARFSVTRDDEVLEIEYRMKHANGQWRWLRSCDVVFARNEHGQAQTILGSAEDITERKRAEESLRQSEDRVRFALEVSNTGAWDLDLLNHTAHRSLWHDKIFGYESLLPEWTYEMFLGHVLPEDREAVDQKFRQAVASGGDWSFECRIRCCDGQIRWIWAAGRHRTDASGKPTRMVGIVQDITERKRNEETIRETQERLALAANAAQIGMFDWNVRTSEVAWTQQHEVIFGYPTTTTTTTTTQHPYRDWANRVHPDDLPWIEERIRQCLPERTLYQVEYRIVWPDGSLHWIAGQGRAYFDAEGRATRMLGTVMDITQRKTHEREIERLNRLYAALSELNQVIVGIESREELFREVCRIITERAGFQLAWIGWIEKETYRVIPIARDGVKQDYLDEIRVYADDRPEGHGPTGSCIREDRVYVVHDFLNDPCTAPWREAIAKHGFRTSAALPIRFRGVVCGALTAYGNEPNVIHDKESALLEEAAAAISLALENLDHESQRKQAENKLIASEATLREAQTLAHLGSYILDIPQGRWTSSEVLDQIFDIPSDYSRTVEGWGDLVHPDERQEMLDYIRKDVFGKHELFDRVYRIVRYGDKQVRWVHGLGRLEFDASGHPTAMLGTIQDITERKRAEVALRTSEERHRTILQTAMNGFWLVDSEARLLEVNDAYCRMSGYSTQELLAMRIPDLESTEADADTAAHMQEIMTRGEDRFESRHRRKDGSVFDVEVNVQYRQAEGGRFVAFLQDITERKRAEQELRHAKDAAEAANRAKTEFLANMSHEIRTPMTAVLGFSDILLMSPELSPSEQRDFLAGIQKNGKALLGLIDDILDLTRIEADRLPLEKADYPLRQIVDDAIAAVQVQAKQKGLSLDVDYQYPLPETIHTDRARLCQVLVNLLGNAVKFTGQGGVRITIGCTRDADGVGQIRFAVSDTGIGIAADKIAELFQPFMQVDASSTRRYGGSGLGLAISRRLAKALGGDIEVTSQLGMESTFTLTIDAGSLTSVSLLQSPHVTPSVRELLPDKQEIPLHGRVLYAEDDAEVQPLIRFLLKGMNLEVEMANDGRIACDMAEKSKAEGRPYDLILMDIQMPEMNGYDATRWLRQHGWPGPIVALTAYAMVGDREKCLAAGCDDYISKPVTPQGLREMLTRHIPAPDDTTAARDANPTDPAQAIAPPDVQTTPRTAIDQLCERFINGLPERTQALEEAWRAGDRKALAQAAHQLKGTSGAYGLRSIAQAAEAVERHATGESMLSELQQAVHELLTHCSHAGEPGRRA